MASSEDEQDNDFPWEIGIFDAHCHPTDTISAISDISTMEARALTIMATRAQDQDLVAEVATNAGCQNINVAFDVPARVVPSFGWHPWFSHQIYDDEASCNDNKSYEHNVEKKISHYQTVLRPTSNDRDFLISLPDPIPLSSLIFETKKRLEKFPYALVGEIGLDKAFRIPQTWLPRQIEERDEFLTPGGREGRSLSPYRVAMEHQRKILFAQFKLAGEMQRAVSVHGVQAHGILFETLKETFKGHERKVVSNRKKKQRGSAQSARNQSEEPIESQRGALFPPRVCLHSYSGHVDTMRQYMHQEIPVDVYVSFSIVINFTSPASSNTEEVIRAVPSDRILIESDMHVAGAQMDKNLKEIAIKICTLKNWDLSDGLEQLKQNWKDFVFGRND